MTKKQVSQERKARVAQMQKQEKARERRIRLQIIAGCAALLLVLAAVITYAALDARKKQPDVAISTFGVSAAAAACSPVTTDPAKGNGVHVGPARAPPRRRRSSTRPSRRPSGPHFAQPIVADRKVYTAADKPAIENLVHNLEHGYTVLWYDQKAGEAKMDVLRKIADAANKLDASKDKFIVSPWDPAYGAFPAGKKFALSHWSATLGADKASVASQAGHRQLCGDLSGAVVKSFVESHPRTSAPEPFGA